jgi:phage repressor protein C with HTH and peptisase S24 domain
LTGSELKQKLEFEGVEFADLARKLEMSPQNLQNKFRSKDVKFDFLKRVAIAINKSVYDLTEETGENPHLNPHLNPHPKDKIHDQIGKDVVNDPGHFDITSRKAKVLLVPVKARAGYLAGYGDPEYYEHLEYYSIPGCTNGNYRMFEVEGASMYPTLKEGDYAIGQRITERQDIKTGRIYIIVSRTEGIVIKRVVNDSNMPDKLILNSDNEDSKLYPPIKVKGSTILELWELYKVITDPLLPPDPVTRRIDTLEKEMKELRHILTAR